MVAAGIRGASPEAGGDGDIFLKEKVAADRDPEPGGEGALRFQHKVLAIDEARKRPFKTKPVFCGGGENKLVADIREHDEAFELMIAVSALTLDMKGQVDLGAGRLTNGVGRSAPVRGGAQIIG